MRGPWRWVCRYQRLRRRFGSRTLGLWGEEATKLFVREALNEALKLESALARLRTSQRIALLHYSPIKETVEGEPPEIFPFLGTSRLEEPLTLYPVAAVFHGHAHKGSRRGTPRMASRSTMSRYRCCAPHSPIGQRFTS